MPEVLDKKKTITNFSTLKKGDVLSETQFYKVIKTSGDKVQLQNDNGEDIVVGKPYVESLLNSANQFTETKKVSMTEAATIFQNSTNIAVTVNFNTKVKEADVVKEIMDTFEGSTMKSMESAVKKAIKTALEGKERTMIGRHYGHMNELGRISFIDMEETKDPSKDYDTRTRLVDPRTLNWLVVRGVKYVVK